MTKSTWRKPPTYCRFHGRRIIIFLNGVGGCRKCVDDTVKVLQARAVKKDENSA